MKKEFIEALDKITDKLINLDHDEFIKLMLEHKEGKYASILKDAGFFYQQDCYYEFEINPISVLLETSKIFFTPDTKNDIYTVPSNQKFYGISETINNYGEDQWLSPAA